MWPSGLEEMLWGKPWFVCPYPDVVGDAADGDNCISGQEEVFSHFFSQSHGAKSVQITEDHLPLCPISSHTYKIHISQNLHFNVLQMIMQSKVITSLPCITSTAVSWPCQCEPAAQIMRVGGWVRRSTQDLIGYECCRLDEERQQCGWTADSLSLLAHSLFPTAVAVFEVDWGRTLKKIYIYSAKCTGKVPSYMVVTSITMKRSRGWACILTNERICWMSSSWRQDQNAEGSAFVKSVTFLAA